MGYGDALIASSVVKKAKARFPDKPVCIGNGSLIEWSEVYDHNPNISREVTKDCVWVKHHTGRRPYISRIEKDGYVYDRTFRVEPGEIFLTDEERDWPDRDFVYIEPNVKNEVSPNKDWGFDKWQEVVNALPGIRFIQGRGRALAGVEQRETQSFRHAVGLLSHASLFVGTDGGLHHAAAAIGKRAVVVWTGFSPSKSLGYSSHTNLQATDDICGRFYACKHCLEAANKITAGMVVESILRFVGKTGDV